MSLYGEYMMKEMIIWNLKMFTNILKLMLSFDYGNSIGEMRIWSIKTVVPPKKLINQSLINFLGECDTISEGLSHTRLFLIIFFFKLKK